MMMKKLPEDFLIGASTAAHQVEGNNIHSDFWAQEQMEHSDFVEPSLDAVDHYNRYEEDIRLMKEAGLNAYRFSIEWARIEPEKGIYCQEEVEHYRKVIECCLENGIKPVVTMHHFSSPKWLITEGGWENEETINYFASYCAYVMENLGGLLEYVCTINEANMGLQIALVAEEMMRRMKEGKTGDLQVGIDLSELMKQREEQQKEMEKVFGIPADQVHTFLSMLSKKGDEIIMRSHAAARDAMKKVQPHLKVGATFSLYDLQPEPDGEEKAKELWEQDFGHYLPYLMDDDFIGVQNYTRKRVSANGSLPEPEGAELTDMGYEFYPWAVSHVAEKVYEQTKKPVLITENGIATADDTRRCAYINEALEGVAQCIENQVPVLGYLHWSLLDNFEWQKGFCMKFGLIAVDRTTQKRCPKPSLYELGKWR